MNLLHAIQNVRSYYIPSPHEEALGLEEEAFARARAEAIKNYRTYIADMQALTFEQFNAVSYYRLHHCPWLLDHDTGSYDTDCGQKFLLDEGTPAENNFKFCPFCGKHLRLEDAGAEER